MIDTRVLPHAVEMCKKEGFRRFYDETTGFRSQGDCVSFVATGGTNVPAGR